MNYLCDAVSCFKTLIHVYLSANIKLLIAGTVRIDSGREDYADVTFVAHPDWKDKARLGPKCSNRSKSFECKDITVGDKADEIMVKVQ